MKRLDVRQNDAGQRLDKFLNKAFPALPASLLHKSLRKKRIKRNGGRAQGADRLVEGDVIELYLNDDLLEGRQERQAALLLQPRLDVVYEDEHLLIADKPAGLLVHSDDSESVHTLIAHIQAYLYQKGEYNPLQEHSFAPALCNRLDRNTAGLCLAAKTAEALRDLNEIIRTRQMKKIYLALVHGTPKPDEGVLTGYLTRNIEAATVSVSRRAQPGAKPIETRYKVLRSANGLSLLEIDLVTGRTHQIRAHFASIGHPLYGDGKYGREGRARPQKHQALCAWQLRFEFEEYEGILSYLDKKQFYSAQTQIFDDFSR